MPFLQKRVAQSASAVAHVSPDVVEWVEVGPNGVLHASVTPESSDPVELASAVHRARKEAGSKTRRCVLALGKAFAPDRILDLPRQLTKKELRGLLERKATSLLMSDEEGAAEPTALFHSWSSGQMAEREGQDASWHLVAMDQHLVTALGLALRSRGYRVQHVAALQLAPLAAAVHLSESDGEPVLYVVFHEDRMDVGLIVEDNVLTRRSMEGNPTTNATVATGLFHELRGIAGFWRKTSRGGTIEKVVLIGLHPDRAELLSNGVGGVIGNAKVTNYPAPDDPHADRLAGRAARLLCARFTGPMSPNLQCRLPARRAVVALTATLAGVAAFALGSRVGDDLSGTLEQVRCENTEMTSKATTLRPVDTSLQVVKKDTEILEQALERTARIGAFAPPLRRLLTESIAALPSNADLVSMRMFDAGEQDYRYELQGTIRGSSAEVLRGMRDLREVLSASELLTDVEPSLADRLPVNETVGQPFHVLAHCKRGVE